MKQTKRDSASSSTELFPSRIDGGTQNPKIASSVGGGLSHHNFPVNTDLDTEVYFCLNYGARAPSTHNTQPWRFSFEGNTVLVFIDPTRRLPEADKDGRDLYISVGACIEHLVVAFRYFQMFGDLAIGDCNDPLAPVATFTIHKSNGTDATYRALIEAIETRFNARGLFRSQTVPASALEHVGGMEEGDARPILTDSDKDIEVIAELTSQGMRRAHANPSFRKELSKWMISNYSSRKDGIPGFAMLVPGPLSLMLPWLIGTFNMGGVLSSLNLKAIKSSAAVGVVHTATDNPRAWLDTGRLFQRISLRLNIGGIRTSIFVASIEDPTLRMKVAERFSPGRLPQFVFAVGYPKVLLQQSPRLMPNERMYKTSSS